VLAQKTGQLITTPRLPRVIATTSSSPVHHQDELAIFLIAACHCHLGIGISNKRMFTPRMRSESRATRKKFESICIGVIKTL